MFNKLLSSTLGSSNKRILKKLSGRLKEVNDWEPKLQKLTDAQLKAKFGAFKERYAKGETLEAMLPEAFATVREGGKRFLNMRHFDVQILGGLVLFQGNIAEMRTGEGKTLVATLPIYLSAIQGDGVHLVTVNDYLAKRDSAWMGRLYEGLGMKVGVIYSNQPHDEKQQAYSCDVTYGTNNEFGFDFLRDNLALSQGAKVQRKLNFAIVDEVDSILVDEARTPLIISGPHEGAVTLYQQVDKAVDGLKRQHVLEDGTVTEEGDFVLDEKQRAVEITDTGHQKLEEKLIGMELLPPGSSLYESENIHLLHHLQAALKAHHLFKRNVSYLIQGGQAVIVDEHTGRAMPGRRWSEGIHQAIEAKEGLEVQQENQTLASTTFQNYFRLYDTLSGMTGTADTEAYEFHEIYGLNVVVIPTHREMVRDDMNDTVYMTRKEKFNAIVKDVMECRKNNRPVLVGTASVEHSEQLSKELDKNKISHNVLNAKNHFKEAEIIAEAGRPGSITIATNMAGRGTDIVLGGNLDKEIEVLGDDATEKEKEAAQKDWQKRHDLVLKQGGLHVIGSERHESRRIDNQLRGRSGRQGDAGSSHFYLSMEDDLLRLFAPEKIVNMMRSLGLPEDEAIEHRMISSAIERAQGKVEGRNFDIRKQLLEYDDVANNQRTVIYEQRNEIMNIENLNEAIRENIEDQVRELVAVTEIQANSLPPAEFAEIFKNFKENMQASFSLNLDEQKDLGKISSVAEFGKKCKDLPALVYTAYKERLGMLDDSNRDKLEKQVMLQVLDNLWRRHLQSMEYLRQEIYLRGYAQRNPKEEYKKEGYSMFEKLLERIKFDTARILCNLRIRNADEQYAEAKQAEQTAAAKAEHKSLDSFAGEADAGGGEAAEKAEAAGGSEAAAGSKAAEGSEAAKKAKSSPSIAPKPAAGQASPKGGKSPLRPQPMPSAADADDAPKPFIRAGEKIGRNHPCPCGSGKKYKNCHGKTI